MKSRILLWILTSVAVTACFLRLQHSDPGLGKEASFLINDRVTKTQLNPADLGYINPNIEIGWGSIGEPPPALSAEDIAAQEAQWEVHKRAYAQGELEPIPSAEEWAKIEASTDEYFDRLKEILTDGASLTSTEAEPTPFGTTKASYILSSKTFVCEKSLLATSAMALPDSAVQMIIEQGISSFDCRVRQPAPAG